MSLQSIFWPTSSLASSSRHTLRSSSCTLRLGRRYSSEPRTDELRQRPLPDILTTLRSEQKKFTFPPGRVKALAMRYDKFAMSPGFREFINVDVPRIKYANPSLLIRPYILSSIPYPPPKAQKKEKQEKRARTQRSDNVPRISDEEPATHWTSSERAAPSFADVTSGPELSTQSIEDALPDSTGPAADATSGTAPSTQPEEEVSEEDPVEDNGEIAPDPLEVDGGKWRERFKAAKDKNQLLPSEVIIEYDGRPHRTIRFAGDDSSRLIGQILDVVHDREILIDSPESSELLSIGAEERLGIESPVDQADSTLAAEGALNGATDVDRSANLAAGDQASADSGELDVDGTKRMASA